MALKATGFWTGRRPQVAPDPAYPQGKPMDMTLGGPGCTIELQHPAPSIGQWLVECDVCGFTAVITAAGRPDDPSSVTLPCKTVGAE